MLVNIVGIDPGLVDTGLINFQFDTKNKVLTPLYGVVHNDSDPEDMPRVSSSTVKEIATWAQVQSPDHIFIEEYVPRLAFKTDTHMVELQALLRLLIEDAKFIPNHGVLKIISKGTLQLLQAYDFDMKTNHQDIRSAARIALYGMVKNEELNKLLFDVLHDLLNGGKWNVLLAEPRF